MTANQLLKNALSYLQTTQAKDGSFLGQASLDPHDFTSYRTHYTGFITSLIAISLHDVPGSDHITAKATDFILKQRSPEWTWNYWLPGSVDHNTRPYPDDLDDTACALSAISLIAKRNIDGGVLGNFARQLIGQETAAGGPYSSWLVDKNADKTWRDVDCAVNANIKFFLRQHDVHLDGLDDYIRKALQVGEIKSRYYIGDIPVLYFIARAYEGEKLDALQGCIIKHFDDSAYSNNPLMLALLLSAACYAGVSKAARSAIYRRLLELATDDTYWQADALYYEPIFESKQYYAGSPALTTALALQAITLHNRKRQPLAQKSQPIQKPLELPNLPPDPALSDLYLSSVHKLIASDKKHEVSKIATTVASACGFSIPESVLLQLELGCINGWTAYTIYDDVLDGESNPSLLGVANVAGRRMIDNFRMALPDSHEFQRLVADTIDGVDAANTWEVLHARGRVQDGWLTFSSSLPRYGSLGLLARRSWGHVLAPTGVLVAAGYDVDSQEVRQLHSFFKHYITARQLNDDAHDWEEDLKSGHLTAVICKLLTPFDTRSHSIDLKALNDELRIHYWTETILVIIKDIQKQCALARTSLKRCHFIIDPSTLEQWIAHLEAACWEALQARAEAIAFMQGYQNSGK